MTPLTPTRVARLQQIFEEVLLASADERTALLERICAGDDALRDEVQALVAAHDSGATLLDHGPDLTPLAQAMIDPERWIGQRIGPWQVTRLIGFGGMGTVCEAVRADEQFQKRVAVKFLHVHASQPAAVRRFRAERQILANLDHPNVATLLDGGVTDEGQPYLVMEYIDGEPITSWADHQGLSRRACVKLCLQACAAVEAAHSSLIVHRDLKPGNILVTRDGRVKLLDFGIARLLGEVSSDGGGVSRSSEPLSFTPAYAAPEQMRAEPVTTATDVFALGAVFFRLLTGRVPFESRQDPQVAAAAAGLEPDLDAILARAMAVDRQQRYATVEAMRIDLQRWLEGRPVEAHAGGRIYRAAKFMRRHRAGCAAGAIGTLAILVATGMALWQYQNARQAAADQQQLNAFLMDVLAMSDPFEEGDELTLSAALDRAAENIDLRFADRPDLSAQIRYGIGYSMASRYRLEQAQVQLERALQESLTQFGPQDLRTLRVLDGIAGLQLERSEFAAAEAGYQEVIARLESGGHNDDPFHVTVLGNLGNVYLQQERYAEADALLQRALDAQAQLPVPMAGNDRAALLSNLAHAAHGVEDQPRADRYYREAADAFRSLFPQGSPDLAILFNNHAMLLEERGDVEGALGMYRQSLQMRRRMFRGPHPMLVNALVAIARLSLRTGDGAAALAHAAEGAAIADQVYTEPNRFHPSIHATLAAAQLAEDAPAALQSWTRARQLLVALPDAPPSVASWVEEVRTQLCADARLRCPPSALVQASP